MATRQVLAELAEAYERRSGDNVLIGEFGEEKRTFQPISRMPRGSIVSAPVKTAITPGDSFADAGRRRLNRAHTDSWRAAMNPRRPHPSSRSAHAKAMSST